MVDKVLSEREDLRSLVLVIDDLRGSAHVEAARRRQRC